MLSEGGGFVSTYLVSSLFAAGYAFYFGGEPRLVEACRGEFTGDVHAEKFTYGDMQI